MRKKYIAIKCENSKYCKDVPYISKKEFRKNEDNVIVGKTRLKKYKFSSEKKELDLLLFNNKPRNWQLELIIMLVNQYKILKFNILRL